MGEAALAIQERATDTAGAVEAVFALFHLVGYRFAPRIRDLNERRPFTIGRGRSHGVLAPTIAGPASVTTIEENRDEVLRPDARVPPAPCRARGDPAQERRLPPPERPRRDARGDRPRRALAPRRRLADGARAAPPLERQLNKGESRHALARAVFFHRLGELRDRTAETLAYRASGLNLVVNAIVLWNTTHLARAVAYVRSQGVPLADEDLAHMTPIRWGHIALTGDYLWAELERPANASDPCALGASTPYASPALTAQSRRGPHGIRGRPSPRGRRSRAGSGNTCS